MKAESEIHWDRRKIHKKLREGSSTQLDESEAADLKDSVLLSYFSVEREERKGEANSTRWFLFIDEFFNESWDGVSLKRQLLPYFSYFLEEFPLLKWGLSLYWIERITLAFGTEKFDTDNNEYKWESRCPPLVVSLPAQTKGKCPDHFQKRCVSHAS